MEEDKKTTKKEEKKLNLYQKINELKKVVKILVKDAKTEGYGSYTYVSGSQILSAIKDKMEELQILLLPTATKHHNYETYNYTTKNGQKTDFIVSGEIRYEWINAENPDERQIVEWQYYGQQNDISKAFGSGLTYSERYVLLKSLGVPTDDEDPDAKTENKVQNSSNKTKFVIVNELIKDSEIKLATVNEWIKKKYKKSITINNLSDEQFAELIDSLKKSINGEATENE